MEVVVISYYVGELGLDSYRGIAPEVGCNYFHMLVVDCVADYIHNPFPYFDYPLSLIESFGLMIAHHY